MISVDWSVGCSFGMVRSLPTTWKCKANPEDFRWTIQEHGLGEILDKYLRELLSIVRPSTWPSLDQSRLSMDVGENMERHDLGRLALGVSHIVAVCLGADAGSQDVQGSSS